LAGIFAASGLNSAGNGIATFGITANNTGSSRLSTLIAGGHSTPVAQLACSICTPDVSIASVVSGAPFESAISSGSWVTIYGTNLAGTTRQAGNDDFSGAKLPLSLDGVTVRIDGPARRRLLH
jgi:hypothetical protein